MKTIIAPLAGLALLALGAGTASAASPAYCTLYADEYAKHATLEGQGSVPADYVRSRAYHKCLNSDEEPLLPTAYAEPEADDGIGGPYVALEGEGSAFAGEAAAGIAAVEAATPAEAAPTEETPAEEETAAVEAEPQPEPAAARSSGGGGSGLVAWSSEWKAWCKEHFPNSWDAETGTVIPFETNKRELCR